MIFARALGDTLRHLLETDRDVVLLGEDILDPYGGAFKVTRGLSTDFSDRVFTTPVSEGAIAGISAGLALAGFRPIAEIMFGDFVGLCFDQIVNHIAKYQQMYNYQVSCPVVIRTPSGGGRGYGPTHSQSLEKHFMGIPNLRVVAASLYHDPDLIFRDFLAGEAPVLYIEHKLLYPMQMATTDEEFGGDSVAIAENTPGSLPTISLSAVPPEDCSVTVLAYGYQAVVVERILQRLAVEDEIFVQVLVPAQIAPMDWAPVIRSVNNTGRLITVEEGTQTWSWGSEAAAVIGKECFGRLHCPVEVVASQATIIPSAQPREKQMLVNENQIERAIRGAMP
jgi:pyruvate/2-oxoglutarate/acetoin dehydrogenase E1 component